MRLAWGGENQLQAFKGYQFPITTWKQPKKDKKHMKIGRVQGSWEGPNICQEPH